jgi:competence protein ComGC
MIRNQKGYSMVELFAVIFIVSAIVFPMISSLVSNIEINARYHNKRSAVSIAQTTVEGFERIPFGEIDALMDVANLTGFVLELDSTQCEVFTTDAASLCSGLFNSTWSNFSVDSDHFKIYVYNYNITATMQNTLLSSLLIPQAVKDEIASLPTTDVANPDLYYITAYILYDDDTNSSITVTGLISNE